MSKIDKRARIELAIIEGTRQLILEDKNINAIIISLKLVDKPDYSKAAYLSINVYNL